MRASQFTGGFGGNRNSNVLNPSQGQDPFEKSTPAPKPGNASRAGITFSGSVAGALPRSSNFESAYENISLTGPSRQVFKRMGERAANQDINAYNANATSENEAARAVKAREVSDYEQQTNELTNTFNSQKQAYDNAYWAYDQELAGYQNRQTDIRRLNQLYGNMTFYGSILTNPSYIRQPADYTIYNNLYQQNKSLFNGYSSSLKSQYPPLSHMFTGLFTDADIRRPTIEYPTAPKLPKAPDPFIQLQQMKELLSDPPDRRLAANQREAVGGDLPPQVANTTGSAFDQVDVPFRDASQFNAVEQTRLGLPKAYRVNSGFVAQAGNNTSYGGQVFTADQITNQNSTHYYIPGLGWTAKTSLTPLY